MPETAFGQVDPDRIRQVVDNILGNVRVHTKTGTDVQVSLLEADDAISLTVTDSGPGIDVVDRAHLFERFWRADASRERATGGSGLGLAIVSSIVAAHGGTVALVEPDPSCPLQGASFRVTLPK